MIVQAAEAFQFDTIDDVVSDVARGRIVIVTDDADRENEGDLVMAAEKATAETVNAAAAPSAINVFFMASPFSWGAQDNQVLSGKKFHISLE